MAEPALRNVSDTALLVAMHRARESERPDRVFRDPYARALAGERGERIARELAFGLAGWPVVARTIFFDEQITRLTAGGEVECVLNLAGGLDTRPYRLELPPDLLWVESDLPDMLAYKTHRLAAEDPRCRLERVAADLSDPLARGRVLDHTAARSTVVLTEGLLVYLTAADVIALAQDLLARPNLRFWLLDISGPRAARWGSRGKLGRQLASANATHRFAPEEGPEFFRPYGWVPVEVLSLWRESQRIGRLPWWLGLLEAITPPSRRDPYYDLARVAVLERADES